MEEVKKKRLGAGRVAFLARKEEIKELLDAGHTIITVYEKYQKRFGISYGQFVNYVNKFIKEKPTEKKLEEVPVPAPAPVRKGKEKEPSMIETLKPPPEKDLL